MEWNWLSGNNMTSFLLSESTGDSEEVKSDHVHHEHEHGNEKGVLFSRSKDDQDEVEDDDDAQSCSYDHSPYINTTYDTIGHGQYSQRLIDDDIGNGEIDDEDDDDDDKKNNQNKMMDSSKQQWRSHKSCLNQREIDRKFWETCLAS